MPRWLAIALGGAFFVLVVLLVWPADSQLKSRDCNDPLDCVTLAVNAPLRLGVIQSLSGKVAALGNEQLRGLQLALDRRNHIVAGHPVDLVVEDSGCRPEGGANAALRLISDPSLVAIFGTTCSDDAATAAQVMSPAGFSMISGNNSAPFLTSIDGKQAPKWQPGYFRTAPNEEYSGPAAARYAYTTLGIRQAAIIHDGDIYTMGLAQGFRQEFERLGGQTVFYGAVDKGDADMKPVLEAVAASKAQLLFFPLFQPEGNRVLLTARKMPQLSQLVLMSDGSLIEQSFIDAVGEAAKGMYFVGPTPPKATPAVEALQARYRAQFGGNPASLYYLNAYDAANILFAAVERTAVKRADGTLTIGREALRRALAATKNFPGVTGPLTCDTYGDCAIPSFNVLRLDDPDKGVPGLVANVVFTYTASRNHDR